MKTGTLQGCRAWLSIAAVATAALLGACRRPSPTAPSPTVVSLGVVATAAGSQFQCAATALYSDGSTRDVTTQATWTSSDPSIATVAGGGLVTPVGSGSVDIVAIFSEVSGSLRLAVTVSPPVTVVYTLSGTVRENSPNAKPLANVRVEIVAGTNAGRVATTDAEGRYVLSGLSPGRVTLLVTSAGYEDLRQEEDLRADTTLDFALVLVTTPSPPPPSAATYVLSGVVSAIPLSELLRDADVILSTAPGEPGRVEVSATTNSSGFYRLPGVAAGRYLLRARKFGYRVDDRNVTVSRDDRVDIVMDRSRVTLWGSVELAQPCYDAVPGALVEVLGQEAGTSAVADSAGGYEIPNVAWGSVPVRASRTGYVTFQTTLSIQPPEADFGRPGDRVSYHFRIEDQVGVRGLVGAIRSAASPSELLGGVLVEITAGRNAGRSTTSAADGTYRFTSLLSGSFAASFSKPTFTTQTFNNGVLCGTPLDVRLDVAMTPGSP